MQRSVKIALWNVEWATPQTRRGLLVSAALEAGNPDSICVTEGCAGILPHNGYLITSGQDYGYNSTGERRKVLLWSRSPWSNVDCFGSPLMPSGRFICGTTETSIGPVRCIGVCIPWKDAHVRTGRKDRAPWQDHLAFLDGFNEWLKSTPTDIPSVLLGDFNQRIPRGRQPAHVFSRLEEILHGRFEIMAGGNLDGVEVQSIDHVGISGDLQAGPLMTFSNIAENGMQLSDHFGLRIEVRSRAAGSDSTIR